MRTSPAVRVLAFLILLTAPLSASIRVRVDEIGLKGWSGYSSHGLEPIRFTIENDGTAETLNLKIMVLSLTNSGTRVDSVYREKLTVAQGRMQTMRLLAVTPAESVRMELSNEDGSIAASATSAGITRSVIRGHLVVVYCHDPLVVEKVRRVAIRSNNPEMRTRKERELDFVQVDSLEPQTWYYNDATAIILAEPLVANDEQKRSLERFVRRGGQLVVTSASAASTGFDAAYFNEADSVRMGIGDIHVVSDLEATVLSDIGSDFLAGDSTGRTVLDQTAWRMRFPRTRTMILLTISYILVIGALNFSILRRMGRLELGWITVPAIALLFTAVVVVFAASRGFTKIRIDQAETYYLDTHSATAYVYDGIRVTSPTRSEFTLQLAPGDYFASDPGEWNWAADKAHIGDEILEQRDDVLRQTREFVADGDRVGVALSMMRWSYQEWFGKRFETLKGTVTLNGAEVKNGTGVRFKKAIVIDRDNDKLYDLGPLQQDATGRLSDPKRLEVLVDAPWLRRKEEPPMELSDARLAAITMMKKAFIGVAETDEAGAAAQPRVLERPSQHSQTRIFVVGLE